MTVNSDGPQIGAPPTNGPDIAALSEKYNAERDRRLREDGSSQYEDLASSRFAAIVEDHFVDHEALNAQPSPLEDGQEVQIIILGAGFGGLLTAARLVEAGINPDSIRLVDKAGGFGGTWYWNRYPGLMCDTESSVYTPLLEETDYMPKHRYSYGEELREHAERIARHYRVSANGVFRTTITSAAWDDAARRWRFQLTQDRGPSQPAVHFTATSQFFCFCAGVLAHPKAPRIPGLDTFRGPLLHTARWDYGVSGGSSSSSTELPNLRGKRVGILGTGATAVQAVPRLAAAGVADLFVFQRTPSAVGERGQRAMDAREWRDSIARGPGWQQTHRRAFELLTQGEGAQDAYFRGGWAALPSYQVVAGNSGAGAVAGLADVAGHMERVLVLDAPIQEGIRRRVDAVVRDRAVAEVLKPWYPTWCKRPCFHDDYLEAFNRPNVHVVDTSVTKGALRASAAGLAVGDDGEVIPLDVLILGTRLYGVLQPLHALTAAVSYSHFEHRNSQVLAKAMKFK